MVTKDTPKGKTSSSKKDDELVTDEGATVEAVGPAIPDGAELKSDDGGIAEKARILTDAETNSLIGELEPGETGWLPIDEYGEPTGPAFRGKPAEGQLVAAVQAPGVRPDPGLMTPSGAPVTASMNPSPVSGSESFAEMNERAVDKSKSEE